MYSSSKQVFNLYPLTLLLSFVLLSLLSCSRAEKAQLYLVHIHGDWCNTCKRIDNVIHKVGEHYQDDKEVKFVIFDETSPESVAKSAQLAENLGLEDVFEHQRHTGEVLYVDASSKKVLTKFYGVGEEQEYIISASKILAGKQVPDRLPNPPAYELSKPGLDRLTKAKLYVVDIHHDMCGSCAVTAPVFEEVAEDYANDPDVVFMTFDLTTPRTIDETRELVTKVGLKDIYDARKHTGEVLFVSAADKKLEATLVMERDQEVYHQCIKKLQTN